jgi:hypothetical protein
MIDFVGKPFEDNIFTKKEELLRIYEFSNDEFALIKLNRE